MSLSEIIVVAAAAQARTGDSSGLGGVAMGDHEGGEDVSATLVLFPVGVYTPHLSAPETLRVVLAAEETRT
ncbi:hypothetical protein VMCG_00082 [Cytospora schulzeri]|uniref:Uncharacterized protein n=1 Tax=Cytospora schulzeri TaxID=448051 RepID=A0A423XA40_9PEZI|nr:hypothetical protein VMCG_00082 [Valsa malicola]